MSTPRNVTEFDDYKKFLHHQIEVYGKNIRGYQNQLSKAAGCKSSYLSQSLHGPVHLTPDHGAGLCQFWQMEDFETDYFLELIQLGRAASQKLVAISRRRLDDIKRKHLDLTGRFKQAKTVRIEDQAVYFSAWHWAAIHGLCSLHGFQTVKQIQTRLGLSAAIIQDTLHKLQRMGLVKQKGNTWAPTEKDIHLSKSSSMITAHHLNWRLRAMLNAQLTDQNAVHYTALYAISRKEFDELRTEIVKLIDESRSRALRSKEEDLFALCCDWFEV